MHIDLKQEMWWVQSFKESMWPMGCTIDNICIPWIGNAHKNF